jgi:hypothetical protein
MPVRRKSNECNAIEVNLMQLERNSIPSNVSEANLMPQSENLMNLMPLKQKSDESSQTYWPLRTSLTC